MTVESAVVHVRGPAWMVFTGGMPHAKFSDHHTVSVVNGASHATFDFSSRVIDFILLSQPTADTGVWSSSVQVYCKIYF